MVAFVIEFIGGFFGMLNQIIGLDYVCGIAVVVAAFGWLYALSHTSTL